MNPKDLELVLCVPNREWRALTGRAWQLDNDCWRRCGEDSANLISLGRWPQASELRLSFHERRDCETDPTLRQIIPYIVVRMQHGDQQGVLVYQRKNGGEVRLDSLYSVGIGGHVNPYDAKTVDAGLPSLVCYAAERETCEELPEWLWHNQADDEDTADEIFTPVCWIDDCTNDVGRVHLGAVFVVDRVINDPESWKSVQHGVQLDCGVGKVVTWDEAAAMSDKMETWSQRLIKYGLDLIQG